MKVLLLVVAFIIGLSVQAFAGTVIFTYSEPTQTQAGSALTNLKETTVYWKQDNGTEQVLKTPATVVGGGGAISRTAIITDPQLCGSTTITAQATASSTALTNFESPRTAVVTAIKAASQTGCNTPNAPFNLNITIAP